MTPAKVSFALNNTDNITIPGILKLIANDEIDICITLFTLENYYHIVKNKFADQLHLGIYKRRYFIKITLKMIFFNFDRF